LESDDLAIKRVKKRVTEGGHNITKEVIIRRYQRGIDNLFKIYLSLSSEVMIFDNSSSKIELIARGNYGIQEIFNAKKWKKINRQL
jgi:predicted ABC-type ATPase